MAFLLPCSIVGCISPPFKIRESKSSADIPERSSISSFSLLTGSFTATVSATGSTTGSGFGSSLAGSDFFSSGAAGLDTREAKRPLDFLSFSMISEAARCCLPRLDQTKVLSVRLQIFGRHL